MNALAHADTDAPGVPMVDIVIPVYNEEEQLAASVERVREHLATLPWSARVTIADNASTDGTAVIAHRLARHPDVRVVRLSEKGRGRALSRAWGMSESPVLVYMDVDLSTDLNALLPLVAPLVTGHSDLAIGTRLARSARVERGPRREFISRSYNLLLRGALRVRFSDAQCGFKAIRRDAAEVLLPWVEDQAWFFDTEVLVLAERSGLRIHEVPVDWIDDPNSSVHIAATAWADLRGMGRVARGLITGRLPVAEIGAALGRTAPRGFLRQLGSFAGIGIACTVAYSVLYLMLRQAMTPWIANVVALTFTAIANTAANRRLTFRVRGREGRWRHQAQGLAVYGVGLIVTTLALLALHAAGVRSGLIETMVLTVANLLVTVARFVAMRTWMFAGASGNDEGDQRGREPGDEVLAGETGGVRHPRQNRVLDQRRPAAGE